MDRGLSAAHQRLNDARDLARQGRYEEALQEHMWFHEHALEQEPSLRAVRLSFALADWVRLGDVYPKARGALEGIRDRLTDILSVSAENWDAFHEVASINQRLGCEDRTYELFKALAASNKKFAQRCARIALPSVLKARDYALAERFLDDPAHDIRRDGDLLNRTVRTRRRLSYSPAPAIPASIDIYANTVRQVLEVLEGRGRVAEARALRQLAVRQIQATTIRDAVKTALEPGARPWYERGRPREKRQR